VLEVSGSGVHFQTSDHTSQLTECGCLDGGTADRFTPRGEIRSAAAFTHNDTALSGEM
jgi:hypothetical protein